MRKFILLIAIILPIHAHSSEIDVKQCTIDMAKYLSFYNYEGFIPAVARRHVQAALKECKVPFGDKNTKKATKCAYDTLQVYGQLGKQYQLCSEITSTYESQCMKLIYKRYPTKKIRPVDALFECVAVNSQEAIDCIDEKMTSLRGTYFFSKDMIKDCRTKYKHLNCTESEDQYYLE